MRGSNHYNQEELQELADAVQTLNKQVSELYVVFNNNSEHDAFPNAKEMMEMLELEYEGLAPKQLDLFDED